MAIQNKSINLPLDCFATPLPFLLRRYRNRERFNEGLSGGRYRSNALISHDKI